MLKWESFETWLANGNDVECLASLSSLVERLKTAVSEKATIQITTAADQIKQDLQKLKDQWNDFEESLDATAKYWSLYMDMVLILKRYILAGRGGKWQEHLNKAQKMLPFTVSSGHSKYMSCLPIYLHEMNSLQDTAPEVYESFIAGRFNVRVSHGSFNGVWTDLALERLTTKRGRPVFSKVSPRVQLPETSTSRRCPS